MSYLENTPLEKIRDRAQDLKFKSWCPVVMVNDSEQLRKDMKMASEMLLRLLNIKNLIKNYDAQNRKKHFAPCKAKKRV